MNTELLITRIELLCSKKGVNMTTAFIQSGVGKNFKSNLPSVSKKNLNLLANYFGVSVEYLTGEEDENSYIRKVVDAILEWLDENDYEYIEDDDDTVSVGKDGAYVFFTKSDFATECLKIKENSENGFELSMQDWERRNFQDSTSDNIDDYSKQEQTLIKLFRETSEEGRLEMISAFMSIRNRENGIHTIYRAASSSEHEEPRIEQRTATDMGKLKNASTVTSEEDL